MENNIRVTLYKSNYENKSYLCTFEIKKYQQLKRIKQKLREFIQLQQDEKHKTMIFYCSSIEYFNIKLNESHLSTP